MLTVGRFTTPGFTTERGVAGTIPGITGQGGIHGDGMAAVSMAGDGTMADGDQVEMEDIPYPIQKGLFMGAEEVVIRPHPDPGPFDFPIQIEILIK